MKPIQNALSIALIGCGGVGFVVTSGPLLKNKDIDAPLNVLGINRSPYGEVFAMAMQGPIDTYFHATEAQGHHCEDPDHCPHHEIESSQELATVNCAGISDRFRNFIDGMGAGLVERTNPKAASPAHKFFLRRGIEDKLRFAYNLDPGHYGNYNAYHFFLTEPQLGTRPELTPSAARLAQDTIDYSLSRRDDPRLALTAAAASANVIELMFNDRHVHPQNPRFSTAQMRAMLGVCDRALEIYAELTEEWKEQGLWANLSDFRILEIEERSKFIFKVRESQGKAIALLERTPFSYGVVKPNDVWRTSTTIDPFGYGVDPTRKIQKLESAAETDLLQNNTDSRSRTGNTASLSQE